MSNFNRGYDRSRSYGTFSGPTAPFRSITTPSAATGTRPLLPRGLNPWPPMPIRPRQQSTRKQDPTRLLDEALRREEATQARVDEERQKYSRLQLEFVTRRDLLRERIESCRAQLEVGNPVNMTMEYVQGRYEEYRRRYDVLVAGYRQDRAALDFAEEEHRQTVREVASAQRRIQEEGSEEGEPATRRIESSRRMLQEYGFEPEEPQFTIDNEEETSEDEGVSVGRDFEYDNDEGM